MYEFPSCGVPIKKQSGGPTKILTRLYAGLIEGSLGGKVAAGCTSPSPATVHGVKGGSCVCVYPRQLPMAKCGSAVRRPCGKEIIVPLLNVRMGGRAKAREDEYR